MECGYCKKDIDIDKDSIVVITLGETGGYGWVACPICDATLYVGIGPVVLADWRKPEKAL